MDEKLVSIATLALNIALIAIHSMFTWKRNQRPVQACQHSGDIRHLLHEVALLREHFHDMAPKVGAISTLLDALRRFNDFQEKLNELAEQVARIEGGLGRS
jgi:hypothetical protein